MSIKNGSFVFHLFSVFVLLTLLFGTPGVTPAHAATLTVNVLTDENDGSCVDGDCSLRDAVQVAIAGDTITFSITGTITLASQIFLTKNMTINGPGVANLTISGGPTTRVFFVSSGETVSISGLTIANGSAGYGGGIANQGNLTVSNCAFSHNTATPGSGGGGIYNETTGSHLSVSNCTFDNNYAEFGGGIHNYLGMVDVTNSAFTSNSANSSGGAIDTYENALTVTDSTFSTNHSKVGGAIATSSAGSVVISNSTFTGNSATTGYGGGIYAYHTPTSVTNSAFENNTATQKGGGIFNQAVLSTDPLTVRNSTFSGNSAGASSGAGIHNDFGTLNYTNTILANKVSGLDCANYSIIGTNINNLAESGNCLAALSSDPLLGTLGYHGGFTQTIPLLAGSPAIDAGTNTDCPAKDQRGFTRPQDGNLDGTATCDIGSYELIKPATTFGPASQWTTAFDLSHGWTVKDFVRTLGDVNNDGRADLVGFGADGVYVALSTGTGFGAISQWTSAFDLSHGWTVQDFVRTVGDVNKDGRADLIGFGADGVYVALSTGTGFGAVAQWSTGFGLANGWTVQNYVRTLGDVNNDGRADLIGFGADGVYVALSTGTGFGAISQWTSAFDLSHGWTVQDFVRTVGDVNNDGRADLVGFGADGVYVALSTGTGFGAISQWTSAFDLSHGWTVQGFVRTVGDVTGDGNADLIGFGADGVYVALSTGTGFGAISKWTSTFDLSHGWTVQDFVRTVGDVNNDGRADLIGFGLDGVYVALAQ